jgi:hypothetical protein
MREANVRIVQRDDPFAHGRFQRLQDALSVTLHR